MVNFNIMIRNITNTATEISKVEKVLEQFYSTITDKKRLKYINIKTSQKQKSINKLENQNINAF